MQPAFGQINDILENMSDAFYAVDRDWRFSYINRKAEELWDRPRADLLGRVIWEVFPEAVGTEPYYQQLRAAAEGVAVTFETISPIVGRWIRVNAVPNANGVAVYFHDIHARKQDEDDRQRLYAAERRAREAAERAAQRTARLQAITAALSELRKMTTGDGWQKRLSEIVTACVKLHKSESPALVKRFNLHPGRGALLDEDTHQQHRQVTEVLGRGEKGEFAHCARLTARGGARQSPSGHPLVGEWRLQRPSGRGTPRGASAGRRSPSVTARGLRKAGVA